MLWGGVSGVVGRSERCCEEGVSNVVGGVRGVVWEE